MGGSVRAGAPQGAPWTCGAMSARQGGAPRVSLEGVVDGRIACARLGLLGCGVYGSQRLALLAA